MVQAWFVTCPECSREIEISPNEVYTECGHAMSDCQCPRCQFKFRAEKDYLLWLGLEGPVPSEILDK
jgi:hypothetical protein